MSVWREKQVLNEMWDVDGVKERAFWEWCDSSEKHEKEKVERTYERDWRISWKDEKERRGDKGSERIVEQLGWHDGVDFV